MIRGQRKKLRHQLLYQSAVKDSPEARKAALAAKQEVRSLSASLNKILECFSALDKAGSGANSLGSLSSNRAKRAATVHMDSVVPMVELDYEGAPTVECNVMFSQGPAAVVLSKLTGDATALHTTNTVINFPLSQVPNVSLYNECIG